MTVDTNRQETIVPEATRKIVRNRSAIGGRRYDQNDINFLKANWDKADADELARRMVRTEKAIKTKIHVLKAQGIIRPPERDLSPIVPETTVANPSNVQPSTTQPTAMRSAVTEPVFYTMAISITIDGSNVDVITEQLALKHFMARLFDLSTCITTPSGPVECSVSGVGDFKRL